MLRNAAFLLLSPSPLNNPPSPPISDRSPYPPPPLRTDLCPFSSLLSLWTDLWPCPSPPQTPDPRTDLSPFSSLPSPSDRSLTVLLLINDGDAGPVEEAHDVPERGVHQRLVRVQVDAELPAVTLHIQSALHVRDVQRVTDRLHVRAQLGVRRPEDGVHAVSRPGDTLWETCDVWVWQQGHL